MVKLIEISNLEINMSCYMQDFYLTSIFLFNSDEYKRNDVKFVNILQNFSPILSVLNSPSDCSILEVINPYNNRKVLKNAYKGVKGIYIWEILNSKDIYVGYSVNLYNRIVSYFKSDILKKGTRKVLVYFRTYGFKDVHLKVYIPKNQTISLEELVKLEQHCIDILKPSLNVDLKARPGGYEPKDWGEKIFLYNKENMKLLYIFLTKKSTYEIINIDYRTLNRCLKEGNLYLDTFFFSKNIIKEWSNSNKELLNMSDLKKIIIEKRRIYDIKIQTKSKMILVENIYNSSLNKYYFSINQLSKEMKIDRETVRNRLNGKINKLYKKEWKFIVIN
jgi:GIY-YIG catalytic domain/NUMOD1 domain